MYDNGGEVAHAFHQSGKFELRVRHGHNEYVREYNEELVMTQIASPFLYLLGAACFAASWFSSPQSAAAGGLAACGDIHVEANAQCELVAPGVTCEGMCTPVSVRAACSAQLAVECHPQCTDLPSVDCTGTCEANCSPTCTNLEPGTFDCRASCEADCSGNCEAHCSGSSNGGECMAQCEGSCSASCAGSCDVDLPQADCDAGCQASCDGSCEADANFDCQAMCQSDSYGSCETDVQGGCELDCQGQDGALFCDGQYVDHNNHLEECVAALRALLNIEVSGHADSSSSCNGNTCMAEASAEGRVTSHCAIARPGQNARDSAAYVLCGLLAALLMRRRRA